LASNSWKKIALTDMSLAGNLSVGGISSNLTPTANVIYNLGSPTQRWKDLWLSGNTIFIGSEAMSVSPAGQWSFTSGGATVNLGSTAAFNPPEANIGGVLRASGNIVAAATTVSTSSTTGALVVNGGVGISGNLNAGNVTANALRTATGLYWSGNGNPITNITFTASPTAPTSPILGDSWYDTDTDILFLRINDGSSNVWVDIGSASANIPDALVSNTITVQRSITVNSANLATAIVNAGTAGTGNIGATGAGFNTVFARATSAQYADLAEKYVADYNYTAGTVVVFGGDQEVTVTTRDHDSRVAGVISTNPAYIMNDSIEGLAVALTGRVPCRVLGPVNKGDLLVTSKLSGTAQRCITERYAPGCILGKSLENIMTSEVKTIEIAVGRF
jgi:hypothetical protein